MSDELAIPDSFIGTVRLFPLANVVLFPQGPLPLHVFEPRYRQMVADALAGDQLLATALLQPGWEGRTDARPPLHPMACVGQIVDHQRLDDGRYALMLSGQSRVRIISEVADDKPYRSARVEVLPDRPVVSALADSLREQLNRLASKWFTALGVSSGEIKGLLNPGITLGSLSDHLSFAMPLPVTFKQELLEELDVERRVGRLVNYLEIFGAPTALFSPEGQFPPDFSPN